jgi:hypothetical protein
MDAITYTEATARIIEMGISVNRTQYRIRVAYGDATMFVLGR